jgi:hypothetical protein
MAPKAAASRRMMISRVFMVSIDAHVARAIPGVKN